MSKDLVEDNFVSYDENYDEYIKFLRLLFTEFHDNIEIIDNIMDDDVFNNKTYIELVGVTNYIKRRLFPQMLAFFGQDDQFEDDVYPEFMDIQLMVLYLFDKLNYELDQIVMHFNFNIPVFNESMINLESVNYLLKLIYPQLLLFSKIFDLKIQLIEGSIDEKEFDRLMVEVHDSMFV